MTQRYSATALVASLVLSVCFLIFGPLVQLLPTSANTQHQEKERFIRTSVEAAVTGTTRVDGEPPARKRIDMSQDANCAAIARNPRTEDIIVTGGKLANVFVYLRGGELARFAFDKPQSGVVLDQRQCRFVPRVLGIQTGQSLIIFNSDPTPHNVHPAPRVNEEWNQMQAQNAAPLEKQFTRPETLIPIKCNQHPWMKAYVGVLDHPFFAVSKRDGSFKIDGLPPGDYTLVAWHEAFGEQSVHISVAAGENKPVEFVFGAKTQNSPSGSLKMHTPLEFR